MTVKKRERPLLLGGFSDVVRSYRGCGLRVWHVLGRRMFLLGIYFSKNIKRVSSSRTVFALVLFSFLGERRIRSLLQRLYMTLLIF